MGSFFRCEFEDCPHYKKPVFAEKPFFQRHLVFNHGFENLIQLAYRKGIISDPYRCPSLSFVVNQITELSKVGRF